MTTISSTPASPLPPSYLRALIALGVYLFLGTGIFYSSYKYMVSMWNKEDYTHCYFIPLIIGYLIWEKRNELAKIPSSPSWVGLIPFVGGLFFYWVGELGGEFYTLYVSSWLVIVGLCLLHFGWAVTRRIVFVFFLMLTMFPFPNFIYNKLSLNLQLISSQLGAGLIRLYGFSVHREGNIIDLGITKLQVIDACNGLRYLFPLVVLGLILVYFFKAPLWKRALVLISTVPLAIAVNALRIALAGIGGVYWGPVAIEGFLHDFSGWVIFMICFGLLFGEVWLLKKIGSASRVTVQQVTQTDLPEQKPVDNSSAHPMDGAAQHGNSQKSFKPHFIVAVLLMGTTLALSNMVDFREKTPAHKSFERFPLQTGVWQGKRDVMDPDTFKALHLSDYIIAEYVNPGGKTINFYVAYYESQQKGESIHTPETCLPGGGWNFEKAGAISIPTSAGNGRDCIFVNRAFMKKSNAKELAYYWFPMRGRVLTSLWQLKVYNFWDALTNRRTDGALVRLITPVGEYEDLESADKRLQGFIQDIMPQLREFLPVGIQG